MDGIVGVAPDGDGTGPPVLLAPPLATLAASGAPAGFDRALRLGDDDDHASGAGAGVVPGGGGGDREGGGVSTAVTAAAAAVAVAVAAAAERRRSAFVGDLVGQRRLTVSKPVLKLVRAYGLNALEANT